MTKKTDEKKAKIISLRNLPRKNPSNTKNTNSTTLTTEERLVKLEHEMIYRTAKLAASIEDVDFELGRAKEHIHSLYDYIHYLENKLEELEANL